MYYSMRLSIYKYENSVASPSPHGPPGPALPAAVASPCHHIWHASDTMTQGCPQNLRKLQVGAGVHMFSPRKKVLDSQEPDLPCGKLT